MKKYLLTSFTIAISISVFAQENFLPGYVLPTEGDTIRGYIDYRNWKRTPDEIVFRKSMDEKPMTFKPLHIDAFAVADEVYESAVVEIETSPDRAADLLSTPEFNIVRTFVFLQTIVRGEKSLYYLRNSSGKDHFYIRRDSLLELLRYKRYATWVKNSSTTGESKIVKKNALYINQLVSYLDHPALKSKIERAQYNRSSLEKLFATYYATTGMNTSFENKIEKVAFEMTAIVGVNQTSLELTGGPQKLKNGFDSDVKPVVGVSFDFILPRNQRKWSIVNELIFSSYKVTSEYVDYTSYYWYTKSTMTLGGTYAKLNTMVKFKFPVGKMHFFLNAGMSNGFMVKEVNEQVNFIKENTDESTTKEKVLKVRKYEQGLSGGVGANFKRFSVQARFERSNGVSRYATMKSVVDRSYILLSYRLK